MKNRKLLLIVSLVLAMTMSLGGTLAYLTDTDADVNTMVLGNVKITQNEQEWNADKTELKEFTQDKPLLPVVGDVNWEPSQEDAYRRMTMNNMVDKYVSVTNTGNTDAYVRTIIALEMGSFDINGFANIFSASTNWADGAQFDFPGTWLWPTDIVVTVGEHNFNIMEAVHMDPVKPGETTIPSLLQVYLKSNATNEDLIALDGNNNGKYDILVLSQAVQASGFEAEGDKTAAQVALEAGFGVVNETNVKSWFGDWEQWSPETGEIGTPGDKNDTNNPPVIADVTVTNSDELHKAIVDGYTVIELKDGNYVLADGWTGAHDTYAQNGYNDGYAGLNLQHKTLTLMGGKGAVLNVKGIDERDQFVTGAKLTFNGLTLDFANTIYMGFANTASLTYENCAINGLQLGSGESIKFTNCDLDSKDAEHSFWTWGVKNVSFTDCDFTYGDRAVNCYGQNVTTNASFENCTFTKVAGKETTGAIETNSSTLTALNLTINGCTVNEGNLWWVAQWDSLGGEKTTVNGVPAKAN